MEIPAKISIFNRTLEMKGKQGTLIAVNDAAGYYEVVMEVQQRNHTVLFPITETVVIFNEALPAMGADFEVERQTSSPCREDRAGEDERDKVAAGVDQPQRLRLHPERRSRIAPRGRESKPAQ